MDKNTLRQNMINIVLMDKSDLLKFQQTLSMSSLDKKARDFLQRTIDLRMDCMEVDLSPLVEEAEISIGEV